MKAIIYLLAACQIFIIANGLYLIRMADSAMDKTGVGDLNLWNEYNSEAGVFISISVILWAITLVVVITSKHYMFLPGQVAALIPPSLFFIGWASLWFI